MEPVRRDSAPSRPLQRDSVARLTSEVFVTIRNGIAALVEPASASAAPGTASPLRTMTPSGSSSSPRTPARSASAEHRGHRIGAWPDGPVCSDRQEVPMGLLDGKNALIFGVANDHSIAWGIAQAFHERGRDGRLLVGRESLIERRVRPLAEIDRLDVRRAVRRPGRRADRSASSTRWGEDARATRHPRPRPRLRQARGPRGRLHRDVPRRLRARPRRLRLLARRAHPRGAAAPATRLGDPDADLLRRREGRRELQRHGRREGRARGVGPLPRRGSRAGRRSGSTRSRAGPVRTLAAAGIARLQEDVRLVRRRRAAAGEHHAGGRRRDARSSSARDLSRAVTGEVIYVDGGFNIVGVPVGDD